MDVLEEYVMRFPEYLDGNKIEQTLSMKTYSDSPSAGRSNADNPPKAEKGEARLIKFPEPPLLTEDARKIYRAFDAPEMQADELILKTGLSAGAFSSAMTELELFDLVELQAGKLYKLKLG